MPLIAPRRIETARLIVRPVREADLPALLDVNADEEVTALLPYARWRSMADAAAWLTRMAGIEAGGGAVQLVIADKAPDRAIGTCLLFRFEEASARAELGYVLGQRHWGRGLMHEALTGLLDHAFGDMGLRRIEAEIDVRNVASACVVRRLGFTREGLLRERWVTKGEARDVEVHGLLRDEWARRPAWTRCRTRSRKPFASADRRDAGGMEQSPPVEEDL